MMYEKLRYTQKNYVYPGGLIRVVLSQHIFLATSRTYMCWSLQSRDSYSLAASQQPSRSLNEADL